MKKADFPGRISETLTLEKVLMAAIRVPGVKINRETFLRKELMKYCRKDVIEMAIRYNPAKAGIPRRVIYKIARSVINFETRKVSGISVIASIPSSVNALATVGAASADITSYFAHVFRVVQELAYLYGFEEFDFTQDNVDSETMDYMMVFLGVMFGVQGATTTLKKLADSLAKQVAKKLAQKALTKGTIYPIVKQVAKTVGVHMTKQIFADTVASAIPIVGGLASGGLTWIMFKPCCIKLQHNLMTYNLCDPNFYRDIVDVEAEEQ